jgi:transcriptional regulator with XRE-family HTH domain
MNDRGHGQEDVAKATGLCQSHVSRFLSGQGKRVTSRVEALCQYAELDVKPHNAQQSAERELSQALHQAVGDNTTATLALARIVQALAPILRYLPSEPSSQDPRP